MGPLTGKNIHLGEKQQNTDLVQGFKRKQPVEKGVIFKSKIVKLFLTIGDDVLNCVLPHHQT